jgi:hypothetical protein
MSAPPPINFQWDGVAMVPASPFFARMCDKRFTVGEVYRLEEISERNMASHRHFFASIAEAWQNLPDYMSERFPTSEHLRRYALVKSGFCDQRTIVCSSKAEAQRMAAFVRPMDEFAVVTANESVVTVYTAKSQSVRAMGKADFERSKTAVLEYVASLIHVNPDVLSQNAGRAA